MSHAVFTKQLGRNVSDGTPDRKRWRITRFVLTLARLIKATLLAPIRLFIAVRRAITTASVSIVLIALMTLNIIWGYPWTGMLAACAAVMTVGWICNVVMRPKLSVGCSLPASAPVGQPVRLIAHSKNNRWLPALDVSLGFKEMRSVRRNQSHATFSSSPWDFVPVIRPYGQFDHQASLTFDRRGIHNLPPLNIESTFPFYLFRWSNRVNLGATIAITPQPLDADEDAAAKSLLSTIGGWAHKLLSGTSVEYTGSREYQVGMPVRRWDFASWARLGRPIVREYESPSICSITLLIDASIVETGKKHRSNEQVYDPLFERMLSLAASAISEFVTRSIHISLYLTNEAENVIVGDEVDQTTTGDRESMLIRLAEAFQVDATTSQSRLVSVLDQVGNQPTLVLTCRDERELGEDLPINVSIIRVDMEADRENQ